MRWIHFALLVASCVRTAAAAEIEFMVYQPTVGETWQESGSVQSQINYLATIEGEEQPGSNASSSEAETVIRITGVDGSSIRKLTVRYSRNQTTTQNGSEPPQLQVSPLAGNTYVVELPPSGPLTVSREDGSIPTEAERDLIRDSVGHLERPRTFSAYMASLGKLRPGDDVKLPSSIVQAAWTSALFIATKIEMRLERILAIDSFPVGVFSVDMELANTTGVPYALDAHMRGTMWIDARASRIIKSLLEGPIHLEGEWGGGDEPKISMKGSGTVKSKSETTFPPLSSSFETNPIFLSNVPSPLPSRGSRVPQRGPAVCLLRWARRGGGVALPGVRSGFPRG
jgi:hypothetical protein